MTLTTVSVCFLDLVSAPLQADQIIFFLYLGLRLSPLVTNVTTSDVQSRDNVIINNTFNLYSAFPNAVKPLYRRHILKYPKIETINK